MRKLFKGGTYMRKYGISGLMPNFIKKSWTDSTLKFIKNWRVIGMKNYRKGEGRNCQKIREFLQTYFMDGPIPHTDVKDSEQNHEESSSLFGFMVIGIILAVLFGLIYQRNLKKQRPYRHSDLEDDEIYKYYIGTKSK